MHLLQQGKEAACEDDLAESLPYLANAWSDQSVKYGAFAQAC